MNTLHFFLSLSDRGVLIGYFILCLFCHSGHCNNGSDRSAITLDIMLWGDPGKIFYNAIRDFEKAYPLIRVNDEYYLAERYKIKLPLLMSVNKTPDIFMTWSGSFLENYVKAGKVEPLGDYLLKDPEWHRLFIKGIFDTLSFGGRPYAIPQTRVMAVLFYNKELFKQLGLSPPLTFEELKTEVNIIRSAGYIPLAFGAREPWMGGMLAGLILQRLGGSQLFSDIKTKKIQWTSLPFLKAGAFIKELDRMGAFPKMPETLGYRETIDLFFNEKAAMMAMGSWVLQSLEPHHRLTIDRIGVTGFPLAERDAGLENVWMGQPDMNLAVSSQCPYKDEAVLLIKWISQKRYQCRFMVEAGLLPAVRLLPGPCGDVSPALESLIQHSGKTPSFFLFPDIGLGGIAGKTFNEAIQEIIKGRYCLPVLKQLETLDLFQSEKEAIH